MSAIRKTAGLVASLSPTRLWRRIALAISPALAVLGLMVAPVLIVGSSLVSATPALADGYSPEPGAHWCQTTGYNVHGYQGVACVNFWGQTSSGGWRDYIAVFDLKCGTSAGLVRCTSAMGKFAWYIWDGSSWDPFPDETFKCVTTCATTGNSQQSAYRFSLDRGLCAWLLGSSDTAYPSGGFTFPDGLQSWGQGLTYTPVYQVCS